MPNGGSLSSELSVVFFLASLDPTSGSEQAGKRPIIVVSREDMNHRLPVVNVVPLTSRKTPSRFIYPNEVLLLASPEGLKVDSIALCYQIRTLDKHRLERQLGILTDEHLRRAIVEALRFQLEI
jgi:mRNA interferase MazF